MQEVVGVDFSLNELVPDDELVVFLFFNLIIIDGVLNNVVEIHPPVVDFIFVTSL